MPKHPAGEPEQSDGDRHNAGERDEAAQASDHVGVRQRARGLSGGRADGAGGHDHPDGVSAVVSIHRRVVEHRRAVSVAVPELQGVVAHEALAPRLLVAGPGLLRLGETARRSPCR